MLGLVIGIGAGALLAAVAGARRTTSAYDRFVAAQDGIDVVVSGPGDFCEPPECDPHVVEGLDSVAESVRAVAANFIGGRTSRGAEIAGGAFLLIGSADGRLGSDLNKWLVVDGRAPANDAANEAILTKSLAESLDIRVGDSVEFDVQIGGFDSGEVATVELDVVGIEISPSELEPLSGGALRAVYTTPALVEQRPELWAFEGVAVRLKGGPDARTAFVSDLENYGLEADPSVDSVRQRDAARERFRNDANALVAFAVVGALATVVLAGQALHRQQVLDAAEDDRLRALGCARAELRGVAFLRAAFVAVASTGVAALTAVVLSPFAPVGEARAVEVDRGIDVDWLVLGAGGLAIAAGVVALSMTAAERVIRSRREAPVRVPSSVLNTLSHLPGLHVRLGAGLAFERARRSVPTASVLTSVTLAVAAITAAITFGASLDHLQSSPALYGQPWDAVLFVEYPEPVLATDAERELLAGGEDAGLSAEYFELFGELARRAGDRLAAEPSVAAISRGTSETIHVGPIRDEPSLALDPVKGSLEASIIEGRNPKASDEIAVGDRLLDQLGLGVGDTVEVQRLRVVRDFVNQTFEEVPEIATARIVGRGVFAILDEFESLGGGVVEAPRGGGDLLFIRFAEGADKAALLERFGQEFGLFSGTDFELQDRLLDVEGMEATPVLITALTGFLGAATLLHFGVVAARRHSRHLAVLRSLGMRRRECVRVLAWYVVLIAGAALLVGVPLGIAAGRIAWLAIADGLHVVPVATLPPPATALIAVVVLGAALVTAGVPGRLTTRHAPASALRAE